jgi:hypothetical protein
VRVRNQDRGTPGEDGRLEHLAGLCYGRSYVA